MQLRLSYADLKEFSLIKLFDMIEFYVEIEKKKVAMLKGEMHTSNTRAKEYSADDMEAVW